MIKVSSNAGEDEKSLRRRCMRSKILRCCFSLHNRILLRFQFARNSNEISRWLRFIYGRKNISRQNCILISANGLIRRGVFGPHQKSICHLRVIFVIRRNYSELETRQWRILLISNYNNWKSLAAVSSFRVNRTEDYREAGVGIDWWINKQFLLSITT